jgi:Transport and Golgi organisation 2
MCTLTFAPTNEGFLVGMNRDEQRTRSAALSPEIFNGGNAQAIYPREAGGGTWIACSSRGNLFALLNWYSAETDTLGPKIKTRGDLIPKLVYELDSRSTANRLAGIDLAGMHPFRVVGAFRGEKVLCEWRWDGKHLDCLRFAWGLMHWFSSSLSDSCAAQFRGRTCAAAASDETISTQEWLQTLHKSHDPEPGPYSICMHRPDAATVSYTQVECTPRGIFMDYVGGPPCEQLVLQCNCHSAECQDFSNRRLFVLADCVKLLPCPQL